MTGDVRYRLTRTPFAPRDFGHGSQLPAGFQ